MNKVPAIDVEFKNLNIWAKVKVGKACAKKCKHSSYPSIKQVDP